MNSTKFAIPSYVLTLWIVLISFLCGSQANLRTDYVEELCYNTGHALLDLQARKSGILASVPVEDVDCRIMLKPEKFAQVVISFYRYHIGPGDTLIFKDNQNFQLSLTGDVVFLDERKSLTFDGPVTIYYVTNRTNQPYVEKVKFQFVYTQVYNSPCDGSRDFKCHNNKCIPKYLACDGHNHCGDMTHRDFCSPEIKLESVQTAKVQSGWMISIIVCSIILGIVIIAFIGVLIRGCVLRNKKAKETQLPTTAGAQHGPPTEPSHVQPTAPPSVFERMRQSFRSLRRHPTAPPASTAVAHEQASESYEVPSMYPHLPSAPHLSGVDNPEFKSEE